MRRTLVWTSALVVVLFLGAVALYAASQGNVVSRAASSHAKATAAGGSPSSMATPDLPAPAGISPPPGGISRDQAVAIAAREENVSINTLEWAVVGRWSTLALGQRAQGTDPDPVIWAVTFRGVFVHPCMAPPSPCEPSHHATVFVDYYTGTVIFVADRG